MKYADTHEFTSQVTPVSPRRNKVTAFFEALKLFVTRLFEKRFDPTRMTETERREAGIMDCEIDWYKAWNEPLVK